MNNHSLWAWWHDSKQRGQVAVTALENSNIPPKRFPPKMVCCGHADMYYIPAQGFMHFLVYAPYFIRVFHEVSIPTLAHAISWENDGAPPISTGCHNKSTCCSTMNSEDLPSTPCGHRIDLNNERTRAVMQSILQNKTLL